jgi:hypothetical protein
MHYPYQKILCKIVEFFCAPIGTMGNLVGPDNLSGKEK